MDTTKYESLCIAGRSELSKCKYDANGLKYSLDGKKLLKCKAGASKYVIKNGVETICNGAFKSNKEVESVVIPSSVKYIGSETFYGCVSLSDIIFPSRIVYIGEKAFFKTVIQEANLSLSLIEKIEPETFRFCKSLKTVTFPKQLKYIGEKAFSGSNLDVVDLSKTNTEEIKNGAFSATKIKELFLPSCLKRIESDAFAYVNIKTIDIPDSVEFIGEYAIYSVDLNTAKLPSGLKEIYPRAISVGLRNLSSNSPEFVIDREGLFNKDKSVIYYCTSRDFVIPASIKEIKPYCFGSVIGKISFDEKSTIENIADDAFNGAQIYHLTIPNTVKHIGKRTFLKNGFDVFKVPDGVETIGDEAFKGCYRLKGLYLPSSVKSIGKDILEECCALEIIKVPIGTKERMKDLLSEYEEFITEGDFDSCNYANEYDEVDNEIDDDDEANDEINGDDNYDDNYNDEYYYLIENLPLEIISDITTRVTGLKISNVEINVNDIFKIELNFVAEGRIKENFLLSVALYDADNKIRMVESLHYFNNEEKGFKNKFKKQFEKGIDLEFHYKKIKKVRFFLG